MTEEKQSKKGRRSKTVAIPDIGVSLTPQQDAFARLHAITGQIGPAYIETYNHNGSRKAATVRGCELLQDDDIQKAVEYYREDANKKIDISNDRIIAEYAAMGFSNMADILDALGDKEISDMVNSLSPASQRALKSVKIKRISTPRKDEDDYDIIEFTMHDKKSSLDRIANINGLGGEDKGVAPTKIVINAGGEEVHVNTQVNT